ncbi:MAG: UbiA family prenyltransferase [Pelovirga sp.]
MPVSSPDPAATAAALQFGQRCNALRLLVRLELSAMVVLSALAGYLFGAGAWTQQLLAVLAGVGLLAGGSSALNQWQERDLDERMLRTCMRPLPTGQLTARTVLLLSAGQIGGGLLLLGWLPGKLPLLLGLLAVIWYNAIYTPLKRVTPFAALPGAICGVLPPLIGWTAAGGELLTLKSIILAGTLFVWQIPHTWLLLCHYRDDLRRSGLPDLFRTISTSRLLQINNCWIGSLFLCYLLFPLFGFILYPPLVVAFLIGLLALLIALAKAWYDSPITATALRSFHLVNLSMALLFSVLIIDRILV